MKEIVNSSKTKSSIKRQQNHTFEAQAFLDSAGVAGRLVEYRRSQEIYSQSDPATSVIYIQDGGVKLSVVNEVGRMAVVGMLGPGEFFGEGCLAGRISVQNISADAGRNRWHNAHAGQFLHEQIQETGLHSLPWRTPAPQFPPKCRLARHTAKITHIQG
jgi:hypothetical protein